MQKRNIQGIERVIFLMTKRLQEEPKGPSNKSAVALARLLSSYTRATRGKANGTKRLDEMTPGQLREYHEQNGMPDFYDSLSSGL